MGDLQQLQEQLSRLHSQIQYQQQQLVLYSMCVCVTHARTNEYESACA